MMESLTCLREHDLNLALPRRGQVEGDGGAHVVFPFAESPLLNNLPVRRLHGQHSVTASGPPPKRIMR